MTSDGIQAAQIEPTYDETASNSKCVVLQALPYLIDVAITGICISAKCNAKYIKRNNKRWHS